MNLVINAAEAIGEKPGSVTVTTGVQDLDAKYIETNLLSDDLVPGRYVLLEVTDTGSGMSPETLSRIFDPFFTTKFTGRGLGLAAVLGIVRGHKGAIKINSKLGEGTTFKVFLPACESKVPDLKPDEVPTNFSGDATILVVDDEEPVQKMVRTTLEKYGYHVLTAANGREALKVFQSNYKAIDLVLLDMTMPVMSGEETLIRLREVRRDIRVIVSSGYNEIEALRRFGEAVNGFLQKPYRANQLGEKVKVTLQSSTPA